LTKTAKERIVHAVLLRLLLVLITKQRSLGRLGLSESTKQSSASSILLRLLLSVSKQGSTTTKHSTGFSLVLLLILLTESIVGRAE